MPSWAIHLGVTTKINEKLNYQKVKKIYFY